MRCVHRGRVLVCQRLYVFRDQHPSQQISRLWIMKVCTQTQAHTVSYQPGWGRGIICVSCTLQNVLLSVLHFVLCCVRVRVWAGMDRVNILYLGGSIGVDGDHVLNSLFDFELDVQLSLQGSDAFLVGWRSALGPGRLRTLICGEREKVGYDIKRNKMRVHTVCSKLKKPLREFYLMPNNIVAECTRLISWNMGTVLMTLSWLSVQLEIHCSIYQLATKCKPEAILWLLKMCPTQMEYGKTSHQVILFFHYSEAVPIYQEYVRKNLNWLWRPFTMFIVKLFNKYMHDFHRRKCKVSFIYLKNFDTQVGKYMEQMESCFILIIGY